MIGQVRNLVKGEGVRTLSSVAVWLSQERDREGPYLGIHKDHDRVAS